MEGVFVPWTLAETFLPSLFFWIVRIVLNISVDGRRGSLRSEEETLFFWRWDTVYSGRYRLASNCFLNWVPQMIDKLTPCQVGWESRWRVRAFLLLVILPALCQAERTDFLTWRRRTAGDATLTVSEGVISISFVSPHSPVFQGRLLALCLTF